MKACLLRASWFVCLLAGAGLLLAPGCEAQQDVKSIQLGGILALIPGTKPTNGILWKHGPNKVAEWDDGFGLEVDYYGTYKGRTTLNKETGQLVINNLIKEDSGEYSVEVNGQLQSKTYKVEVYESTHVGWIAGGVVGVLVVVVGLVVAVRLYGQKR